MAATGYNLNHLQVAAKVTTPTYIDVKYATTFEPTITQDSDTFNADGAKVITATGAAEGGGSIGFGSFDTASFGVMTGGTTSTSGTGATLINKVKIPANYNPPAVILVAWIPNVDGNSTMAGMRWTVPNAKLTMPSTQFGQETWSEFSADLSFVLDTTSNAMLIVEEMATAPVFTAGVIPTDLS
jgi:hypothetical protein